MQHTPTLTLPDPGRHRVATLAAPLSVTGLVERVLFHDPASPYTVAVLRVEGDAAPVTVVGRYAEVRGGETLRCEGRWQVHPRFGRQFAAQEVTLLLPASAEGIRRYLASPLVAGIGPVTANRLVQHYGAETLAALDAGEEALRAVAGIGPGRARAIAASWAAHQALREVLLTLFDFGLSYRRVEQLYERFGAMAPLLVRSDPYRLAVDIRGIGFRTADRLAANLGLPAAAPSRLQAGLLHVLQAAAADGHTWVTQERLLTDGATLLSAPRPLPDDALPSPLRAAGEPDAAPASCERSGEHGDNAERAVPRDSVADRDHGAPPEGPAATPPGEAGPGASPPDAVTDERLLGALQSLGEQGKIVTGAVGGQPACALAALATLERALAAGLLRLRDAPFDRLGAWQALDDAGWEAAFAAHAALSAEQRTAVRMALTQRVAVLTGGPGTGKTTTLRALVTLARERGARIALAAPTGRAARRLAEATGLEARTIHRLLRLGYGGAEPDPDDSGDLLPGLDEDTPAPRGRRRSASAIAADLVVVDEASMLDVALARALVRAVPPGAHLLLVGDADQLPSVGPGQVLADVIASGQFPVARLERIFRQGEGSGIAANARRINAGELPIWEPGLGSEDFYLFNAANPDECRALLLDLVVRRIPQRFGLAGQAVQVLAPLHRGPLGLTALNPALQDALNPSSMVKPELNVGARLLRLGDRVVQARNNYDLGVSNGDLGVVEELDPTAFSALVRLDDGRAVRYPARALPELHLAYALSIHRAQGSEFPAVVLPVVTGQFIMLTRRLLYTAVTRARRLVVLLGHSRAVSIAVRDAGSEARLTALAERLRETPEAPAESSPRRGRPRRRALQPALV